MPCRKGAVRFGIYERLLVLTVLFVMLAEVLIFVPSIANFRNNWLANKLAAAHAGTLVLEAAPEGAIPQLAVDDLLRSLDAKALALKMQGRRQLIGLMDTPPMIDARYDLRDPEPIGSIIESLDLLVFGGGRTIDVIGPAPRDGRIRRDRHVGCAVARRHAALLAQYLLLSLMISAVTAALVYLKLFAALSGRLQMLSRGVTAFARKPDDATRIITPSGRTDELGEAETPSLKCRRAFSRR